MRVLRAIRFDATDERVFERAARADEISVLGTGFFDGVPAEALTGKRRQAFAAGFLGAESLGFTTFVAVGEAGEDAVSRATEALAYRCFAELGAPDLDSARRAAGAEMGEARRLAEAHPVNTVLAVERALDAEGIRERVRVVPPPREKDHARIWGAAGDG